MHTALLTPSHRVLIDALKRRGRASVPQLAEDLGLNIETVRDHLKSLVARDLVQRDEAPRREGSTRSGPGRPEIVYSLTDAAEVLFPRREGDVLRELGTYLVHHGHEALLTDFFHQYIARRRNDALARVAPLEGRARVEEVARIFAEFGFMPVLEGEGETPRIRLCHCPLRDLVDATRTPCRTEIGFLAELLGEQLTRVAYIPAGDHSCSYDAARDAC